jgi:hypothetical protein
VTTKKDAPVEPDIARGDRFLGLILDSTQGRGGAALVGVGFALVGPCALAAWWILGSRVGAFAGLPGFFSQWAPTVGDALLLTTLAALVRSSYSDLTVLQRSHAPGVTRVLGSREWMWAFGPAALAVAATVAVHAQWLSNPSIVRNWTLPAPHVLDWPGWLHGAFVALLLYWVIAFIARLVAVARGLAGSKLSEESWSHFELLREKTTACAVLIVAFVSLLYVDNYGYTASLARLAGSWSTVAVLVASVLAVVTCWLWFGMLARGIGSKPTDDDQQRARTASAVPLLALACAAETVTLAWLLEHLAAWPMVTAAAGILGVVMLGAAWFDVYYLNGRKMTPAGGAALGVAWLAAECGYLGAVLAVVTVPAPIERFTALPTLLWLPPSVSILGAGVCLLLVLWLLAREHAIKGTDDTREPARGNLIQNAAMYWGMLQLVVLPVAFLAAGRIVSHGAVHSMQGLLLSGIGPTAYVPLLFGYFGVVTFALSFALNNSWHHIAMLEKQGDPSVASVRAAILFMSVGVAVVAGLALLSMWIGALALFIGMAKI